MVRGLRSAAIGILLMLTQVHAAGAFLSRDAIEVSFELIVNDVVGSPRSGWSSRSDVDQDRRKGCSVA